MIILGISAYFHDSSACIVKDGEIIAALQEERFTRKKNDESFPKNSIIECLNIAGISTHEVDHIVFFEKPFLKFERLLETYLAFAPKGFKSFAKAIPVWINEKMFQKKILQKSLIDIGFIKSQVSGVFFSDHHTSHAASAFFPSPFESSLILTMDGVGEWATTSVAIGNKNSIKKIKEIHFPHSLGLLYSAFTYYCGFKVNSGEYKLMGLAPYGKPHFVSIIKENLISIKEDGSFFLNLDYFNFCTGLTMTNERFDDLFGNVFRLPETELKQVHMDLASSVQVVVEEVVLNMCKQLKNEFSIENLCLAGGLALNCVINGKIHEQKLFKNIFVQPAAGDAGCSVGAALSLYYSYFDNYRHISNCDSMKGAYLGNSYTNEQIEIFLQSKKCSFFKMNIDDLYTFIARKLSESEVVGWFQGRMEFGPRSLGNRSILADPRDPFMQKNLNLKIKNRESFRPFAPSVLEEEVDKYFKFSGISPYMLMITQINDENRYQLDPLKSEFLTGIDLLNIQRSKLPAITHVDYSTRIQTVSRKTNDRFYNLISEFRKITGVPVLVNTSFNVRGEPIVCTLEDAYRCFMGTEIDILVLGDFILLKKDQNATALKSDFMLD